MTTVFNFYVVENSMAILNKQHIMASDYFLSLHRVIQHVHYQN